jgi:hypothetical protein
MTDTTTLHLVRDKRGTVLDMQVRDAQGVLVARLRGFTRSTHKLRVGRRGEWRMRIDDQFVTEEVVDTSKGWKP